MGRAALAAVLAVAAIASGCADGERHEARAAAGGQLEFQRGPNGRERGPYMGVACKVPNSIECDRVGLAVWLGRPAKGLTAVLDGRRRLELESPGNFVGGRGTVWEGYLQPAGLGRGDWGSLDDGAVAVVRLTARYADGTSASRLLLVPLAPGWG